MGDEGEVIGPFKLKHARMADFAHVRLADQVVAIPFAVFAAADRT